jgi:hypothetical protein
MRTKPGLLLASVASAAALTIDVGTAMASGGAAAGGTCTTSSPTAPQGLTQHFSCTQVLTKGKL